MTGPLGGSGLHGSRTVSGPGHPPEGFQSYRAPYEPKPDPELMEDLKGMNTSLREKLRERARHDRYFLARGVLGYQDVNPYTHGPLLRALESSEKRRRMFLMPRGHLKTTLATVTDCVGDAITNPDECRILIVNEVEQNAIGFLSEIKAHFELGEVLRDLFPELLPERYGGPGSRWSTNRACLRRRTTYKEWTWQAVGVGSAVTGSHYTKIKCDDLIGFEARESAATMRYAISYAKAMEPLLINMDDDYIDWVGTRWALMDLYREMLRAYGDEILYFARQDVEIVPAIDPKILKMAGFDEPEMVVGTMQPIFPKKFSMKKLNRLAMIDPVLYYAQFKNNPIADGIKDFQYNRVNKYVFDNYGNVVFRDSEGRICRYSLGQLDIVMTCDPNGGELTAEDPAAIVVTGMGPKGEVFGLESWSKRCQPDEYCERIFEMYARWNCRIVGIEKVAAQQLFFWFQRMQREKSIYLNTFPLTTKSQQKPVRIRRSLTQLINGGLLYLRDDQTTLHHQIQFHPDIENDDELDALAYGVELWRTPATQKEQDEEEDAVETIMSHRSKLTGYSR